eukprot:TRINITY_DN9966_c0_g1_i3.p1 TRINITY_DN9966_c0_g1~~TRINITY_DN9966_c0_g1_i3.p1  ORF type:complete len:470 (-),score=88.79 TRINITY_DN9966_c0_g1_i3:347-1756(-)
MARTRRKTGPGWSPRAAQNEEFKWLVPSVASLILLLALWFDHGSLANVAPTRSRGQWRGSQDRAASLSDRAPATVKLLRKSASEFRELADQFDGHRPVLVTGAVQWPALKEWSRESFAETYPDEMLVLTATRGGLHKREVMVAPVKDLNYHVQNTSTESWALVEDELFLQLREELLSATSAPVYSEHNLFSYFPENCRPSNLTLIWGSAFARSVLRVANFNATAVHLLLTGKRTWKLFPPEQSKYLHIEEGGVTSGLGLQCRSYASPVDAFSPNLNVYPRFAHSNPVVVEQGPGEAVIVPPGWFAQWLGVTETLGTVTPVLNKHNSDIVLSEIMKVPDQVNWNKLPLDLEHLTAEEQIILVTENLVDAVHWRANVTRSAMMMQFGRHLREPGALGGNQPLKLLQEAILSNPQLLGIGDKPPASKPLDGECAQDEEKDSGDEGMKAVDASIQALYTEPQLLEALGLNKGA